MTTARPALLLADLVGSVRLPAVLGYDGTARAVAAAVEHMRAAVLAQGGQILASGGDELLATLSCPDAAWAAAQDLQQHIGSMPLPRGGRLSSRVGLSCGEPDAGGAPRELVLLTAGAGGGQVLATPDFLAGLSMTPPHAPLSLQDIDPDLPPLAACWLGAGARGSVTPPGPATGAAATAEVKPGPGRASGTMLVIQHGGAVHVLDQDRHRVLHIGREPGSDVLLADRKVSRRHARLECRGDAVFYIDTSTNGSFVTQGGAAERFLRQDELRLTMSGQICFGGSANDPASLCIRYEML